MQEEDDDDVDAVVCFPRNSDICKTLAEEDECAPPLVRCQAEFLRHCARCSPDAIRHFIAVIVVVSSKAELYNDVVDVVSLSALDVIETKPFSSWWSLF